MAGLTISGFGGGGGSGDPFGWGVVATASTMAPVANTLINTSGRGVFGRAIGYRPITKIGIEVTNQAGNLDVGVYAGASGYNPPAARRGSAGATSCPAAAYAEVSLTATVNMQAGDYLGLSTDATPGTFLASNVSSTASNIAKGLIYTGNSNYVLPDPVATVGASRGPCYNMLGIP